MLKNIYICLIIIFTFCASASAGTYDEYGGLGPTYGSPVYNTGAASGGTFWATNVSRQVETNGGIPVPGALPTAYTYEQTSITKTKSGTSYTESHKPSTDPNKYSEYAGISASTGYEIWKIYPAVISSSTVQTVISLGQANNQIMANWGPNTYFNFNVFDPGNNQFTYHTYYSDPNGPVLVASAPQAVVPVVSYENIPRTPYTGAPINTAPGSPFLAAAQLYNKTSVSLPEAFKAIRDYIDIVIPDANGGRSTAIEKLITKVENGLPTDLKESAESILTMYMQLNDPSITAEKMIRIYTDPNPAADDYPDWNPTDVIREKVADNSNPYATGPDMVFNANGKLVTGTNIQNSATNSTKILIKGVYYTPSQLPTSRGNRLIMVRVAAYLAAKIGVDPGTIITSGKTDDPNAVAFTKKLVISLNIKAGFDKALDNVSSFRSVIKHENFHKEDNEDITFKSTLSNHAYVYIRQVSDITFATTPPDFKVEMAGSFMNYLLNMDKRIDFTSSEILSRMDQFNKNPYGLVVGRPAPAGVLQKGQLVLELKYNNKTYEAIYKLINE
ncbi:MAG: hypothetical protein ABI576_21160 [Flavobacterium sp.]